MLDDISLSSQRLSTRLLWYVRLEERHPVFAVVFVHKDVDLQTVISTFLLVTSLNITVSFYD